MRNVKIIERTAGDYKYAALDPETGDVLLQLSDKPALVALCERLEWVVADAKALKRRRPDAAESPKPTGEQRRWGRHRPRLGGGTKYAGVRRRRIARLAV